MPDVTYPKNANSDTVFVEDGGKKTRAIKTVEPDGTVTYPSNANSENCYVTVDGKKQRALMTAPQDTSTLEYPNNPNSTKGYVTVNGKKQRVVITANIAGGGSAPVIDELNVTPSTSAQTITAPSGTDGYSPVNVAAVDASIDANIVAGNIKDGVQILGVTGNYTGGAPAHYIEFPVDANGELSQPITTATLGNIKIIGENALYYIFAYNQQITSADLSSVEGIKNNGCTNMFGSLSSAIISVNLERVVFVLTGGFDSFARSARNFTTFNVNSLKIVDGSCFANAFRATPITVLSFPAVKTLSLLSFNNMLVSVTGCTIHFPSNMQTAVESLTGYPNFGGTNTTVLFDLPATVILTGANSQAYERSPKDDTATALAWRKQDTGTVPNLVIDWTPFYTSGTTDPAVSDTIYSDAACTTPVTTISSIA